MGESYPPVISLEKSEKEVKYNQIGKYFKSHFGSSPSFYSRVPGRVNLIGEHIDYCGFSVLPMAIEHEIVLAVGTNDDNMLRISNFDSEKYESFTVAVSNLHIDTSVPRWYHYFLCGYKGVAEKYQLQKKGLDVVVKGTIPPSAGLSSSSALVCATALATCFANRITLSKMELATLCAVSERYIGTEGGGMDQAIAFLAEAGTAKLIDFNPLTATNVPLPKGVVFVVANSCVEMNKAATSQFNIRVVECKIAAKILAKYYNLDWQSVKNLSEVKNSLGRSLEEMSKIIEHVIPQKMLSRCDICSILDISDSELCTMLSSNTQNLQEFKLAQRAKHVYEEAARVENFKLICENANNDAIQELGALMNESHQSCRDLYECSHSELDELVSIAVQAGAIGSRLTGAGWGGCCVSMVMENRVQEFLHVVKSQYYNKKMYSNKDIESLMFVTNPSKGAAIYDSY